MAEKCMQDGSLWEKQDFVDGWEKSIEYCLPQHPPKQLFMQPPLFTRTEQGPGHS
jgi:hypothetical protein